MGLIIGHVEERFLTQPHHLNVGMSQIAGDGDSKIKASVDTASRGASLLLPARNTDYKSRNRTGRYFVLEVPAGTYQIDQWRYRYYRGDSLKLDSYPTFTVEAGKATYIGHIQAVALSMSLRIDNDFESDLAEIKKKYDLAGIPVENRCSNVKNGWWLHEGTKAEDSLVKQILNESSPIVPCP